jgi:hypothetical protein
MLSLTLVCWLAGSWTQTTVVSSCTFKEGRLQRIALLCFLQAMNQAEAARQRAAMAEQAKIELTLALAEAAETKAKDVDTYTTPPPAEAGGDQGTDDEASDGWGEAGDWGDAAAASRNSKGRKGKPTKGGDPGEAAGILGPGETVVQASEMEALLLRTEEAQLAAAVQTRRAAAAEAEADGLKRQLVEAEKRIKDLGWQIQMVMDPVTIGGAGAGGRGGPGGGGAAGGGSSWFADMMGCGANYVRK